MQSLQHERVKLPPSFHGGRENNQPAKRKTFASTTGESNDVAVVRNWTPKQWKQDYMLRNSVSSKRSEQRHKTLVIGFYALEVIVDSCTIVALA